ncbi:MAG TPA: carbohydrate-binding protein [Herpetosiphonaceae bacterium]
MRPYHTLLLALLCAILLSHSPAKSQSATTTPRRVTPAAEPTIEHIGQAAAPQLDWLVSAGTHAYGINTSHKIEITDLTQPDQPRHLGTYTSVWNAYSMKLSGRLLFVVSNAGCDTCYEANILRVLDISNPTQPIEIGAYTAVSGIQGLVATTSHVYLATYSELTVVDISNPAAPQRVGGAPAFSLGWAAETSEGYVYVMSQEDKLDVFDVRNPAQPVRIVEGFTFYVAEVLDTAIVGNRFYAAGGSCPSQVCSGYVRFVDISNPAQPALVGSYATDWAIPSVEAVGPYLHLIHSRTFHRELAIVDARTPSQPQVLASTPLESSAWQRAIAVSNSYIYIAAYNTFFVKRYRLLSTPYGDAPTVPGVIQAEDFDRGGPGAAYADSDSTNRGQSYRPADAVDLEPTTDLGGGTNVGWTAGGEWLQYTINVSATDHYRLQLRLASNGGGGDLHIEIDGATVATLTNLPDTGGYQAWCTLNLGTIPLEAGEHTLRLVLDRNGLNYTVANLNFLQFLPPPREIVYVPVLTNSWS